jgi:hypothetical protein
MHGTSRLCAMSILVSVVPSTVPAAAGRRGRVQA